MKISNLRLRNLTTGLLHTHIDFIYKDIEFLVGDSGIMTHHLGMAAVALKPFLQSRLPASFFERVYKPEEKGETEIEPLTAEERKAFFEVFDVELGKFWAQVSERKAQIAAEAE